MLWNGGWKASESRDGNIELAFQVQNTFLITCSTAHNVQPQQFSCSAYRCGILILRRYFACLRRRTQRNRTNELEKKAKRLRKKLTWINSCWSLHRHENSIFYYHFVQTCSRLASSLHCTPLPPFIPFDRCSEVNIAGDHCAKNRNTPRSMCCDVIFCVRLFARSLATTHAQTQTHTHRHNHRTYTTLNRFL